MGIKMLKVESSLGFRHNLQDEALERNRIIR